MRFRSLPLLVAGSVVLLDRITKMIIERSVSLWENIHVIPGFFDIVHVKNKGAAFGIFGEGDSSVRTFLLIGVSLAVMIFVGILLFRPSRGGFTADKLTTVALSLILGGAVGNLWDRVVRGMVTDFLEFYQGEYRFAAFNIADSAITVGAGLLLIDIWRTRKEPAKT